MTNEERKEQLRKEFNIQVYGHLNNYESKRLFEWFYSILSKKDAEIERLNNLSQAAEEVMGSLSIIDYVDGFRRLYISGPAINNVTALEKYNSLKTKSGGV